MVRWLMEVQMATEFGTLYYADCFETEIVEVDGARYKVVVRFGRPYTVKRWVLGANGAWQTGRPHWAATWAEWYAGLPTGGAKKALAAMGFRWRNETEETFGWWRGDVHLGPGVRGRAADPKSEMALGA